ncbi:ribosomal protein S12 methylthiotransferase accessory factor [Lentzea albidocapillata subsp. violacea]|uniref:Ribosomal protein S12 methylthiotransferase accessory factor n=1 Tax=Lentzea albidocapillata subsp. violacea TaxID=128104 RepID=A0A1G9B9M2_9PSEU|nr:TOMM precursor leader peptide-binding protein [Lentzea albidocapillata]SDK36153.1 ribosomal protein S12 methylthiotransferase accessory factor [Lentzea albidocapillata subsp. violacea]
MRPELAEPGEQRIGFKRHLRPQIVHGEAVYLIGESGVTAIQGSHVEALAPLLDGTRDLTALLRDVPAGLTADRVERMLTRLAAAGLIGRRGMEDGSATTEASLAYWDAAGLDPADAVAATTTSLVSVVTIGDIDRDALAETLHRNGLTITSGSGDLTVVACADYLEPELRAIDEAHRASGTPWLLVKPVGAQVTVGPFFTPGDGPCWRCLATRLSANRTAEAHVRARCGQKGPAPRPLIGLPSLHAMAMEIASVEAAKWLAGVRHEIQRSIWSYDSLSMKVTQHEVRHRPQCGGCGDQEVVARRAFEPVELTSRVKRSCDGGGHRASPPQEVLDHYRHLIGPVTGIVREIRRAEGPAFFNSYRSGANIAASGEGIEGLRSALRADTGGKGVTALDAEVGALCEAVERRSGAFFGDEARVSGSFASLRDMAIHPDAVQQYHPRQFADRDAWNAEHAAFQFVTTPFDENEVMDWTPLWSLTERRHKFLPTGMVYFGAPCPPSVVSNSNGCAAGSSIEDAVLQGLLELVERDAVAIWWYNRTPMPGMDLDSFRDPWISELRQVHAGLGREVWLLDVTSDLGVPTMVAISRRTSGEREDIMLGCGSHLDSRLAARRALTELNQCMPMVCGPMDLGTFDVDMRRWFETTKLAEQPWLAPDPSVPPRDAFHHGYLFRHDLTDDVRALQHTLEQRRMEVLVLDQTRPDIGLPVVRVVVPGLRHFWSRFAQGRLYDVPVQLGRLTRPRRYEELNPIPLFM